MKEKPAYEDATPEECSIAQSIIYAGRKFNSTSLCKLNSKNLSREERKALFDEVYNIASWYVSGKSYSQLSPPIRSEISRLHGLASDFRFRKPFDTVGPSRRKEIEEEIEEENRQAVFEGWSRVLLEKPHLRNAMLHPEDDKAVIDDLPRYLRDEKAHGPFPRRKKSKLVGFSLPP